MVLLWILEGTGKKMDGTAPYIYVNAAEQLEIVGWN
jgi:hypothetical protein